MYFTKKESMVISIILFNFTINFKMKKQITHKANLQFKELQAN